MKNSLIPFCLLMAVATGLLGQPRVGVFYVPGVNVTRFRSARDAVNGDRSRLNLSSEIGIHADFPWARYNFSPALSFIARRNSLSVKERGQSRQTEAHQLQYVGVTLPLKLTTEEYDMAGVTGVRFLFTVGPKFLLRVYHFQESENDEQEQRIVEEFHDGEIALQAVAGTEIPVGLETKIVTGIAYAVGLTELDRDGRYGSRGISLRNTVWGLWVGVIF